MASLVQQLRRSGHEVFLFTLERHPQFDAPGSPGSPPVRFVTLESVFLAVYPKRLAAPTLKNMLLIAKTLKRETPDVLHCTSDGISPFFILAAKLHCVPIVGSVHTDVPELVAEVGIWPIVGAVVCVKDALESRMLDSCATTSPSFKEKLARRGVVCDHVIETGVKVDIFRPEARSEEVRNRLTFGNPDGLLVVYAGRFGPEKRIDKLVSMCSSVDGVYLALIGDGVMGPSLADRHGCWTTQANRRKKGGIFCKTGFVPHKDLAPVYASADVHVSCSQFETLGNTVLEAHACGTSVLVPKAQGFVDTVCHEEDGFLFDGSRLSEGAAYLTRLRDDRALCRRMGERGREKVQMQSPERVARDMVKWYRRACGDVKAEGTVGMLSWVLGLLAIVVNVLMVVAFWFSLDALHGSMRNVVLYVRHTRNMIGNSSFLNKISHIYKAFGNIPMERNMQR